MKVRSGRNTTCQVQADGERRSYGICLHGLAKFYQYGNRLATAEALRLFNSAIEIDPDFALTYSHASRCYAHAEANGWLSDTTHEIADVGVGLAGAPRQIRARIYNHSACGQAIITCCASQ